MCTVTFGVLACPALAEPTDAKVLVARARILADRGDHRGAVSLLETAIAGDSSADLLLQAADEYETLMLDGDDRRDGLLAIARFQQYLSAQKVAPEGRASIENRIRILQELVATLGPGKRAASVEESPGTPAPSEVPISFVADRADDHFQVTSEQRSCETPCTLPLTPGAHRLNLSGSDQLHLGMFVPSAPGTVRLVPSANRFLIPGVLMVVAGAIIAAGMWAVAGDCPSGTLTPVDACTTVNEALWPVFGAGMLATGIGFLSYYGSHQVSRIEVDVDTPPSRSDVKVSSFGLMPMRGGAAAGAGISF
jgi:hypothetical protein